MSVFTIPAGIPFVDALARGILTKFTNKPEDLSSIQILLPTRRACRALSEAFLRLNQGKPMLLPRMTPLGDIDEDELSLTGQLEEPPGDFEILPAISGLRRQLMLTKLVLAFPGNDTTPDQASRLAAELARLLDQVHTERLSFDGLAKLAPDAFSEHWRITLKFLGIITRLWPKALDEENCLDPMERRNRLLEAQTNAWQGTPPTHPIIAAGTTGSIPATADLLKVIAHLPHGSLVLPGLDQEMEDSSWSILGPSHPQFGMARLLKHIHVRRSDVKTWAPETEAPNASDRARLLNLALSPPEAERIVNIPTHGTNGLERIECPTPREEACAIALIMRQTLETPGRCAALVTPDRSLARRVAEELRRWNIRIDDSAGRPLAETPPGAFLRLTAEAAAESLTPVTLLSMLKHPLAAGGQNPAEFRSWARQLEKLLLRGPRPGPGITGLRGALAALRKQAQEQGRNKALQALDQLSPGLNALDDALKPFAHVLNTKNATASALLKAHITFAETLAATDTTQGSEKLWAKEDGEAAANFIAELCEHMDILNAPMDGRRYPALFESLMAGRAVRPVYGRHARLHIWGNLEARLLHADVMILGGLNENTWPPEAPPSPWMSRPMQKEFGLPMPERRIGLSAHDFVQAAAASKVILTRSNRIGGTPTLPSRWLQRLDNLLIGADMPQALAPQDNWLGWAMGMDEPDGPPKPVPPPEPTPPISARPRELPATQIETLIRDPYAIYAKRILKLKVLDPIDCDPDARHRGTVIHDILDKFVRTFPDALPENAEEKLITMGRSAFAQLMAWPIVRALWWPRFVRIAHWFIDWERNRRDDRIKTAGTEIAGFMKLALPAGPFKLTSRTDRIDRLPDGSLAILDYKSGSCPSSPQVECGFAPQLPIGAMIAEKGGFAGLEKAEVSDLLYIQVSGGRTPGAEKRIKPKEGVPNTIQKTHDGLIQMLGRYDLLETAYGSRKRMEKQSYEGDYDHLARIKEWGLGGSGGDE